MPKKTATQEELDGVKNEDKKELEDFEKKEGDEKEEEEEKIDNPNTVYREQLAEQRQKEIHDEIQGDESEEEEETEEEESTEEEVLEETEEEEELFDVVIEGVAKKVTKAELIKSYQIDSVTNKRLQDVTELRKELEETKATQEKLRQDLDLRQDSKDTLPELDDDIIAKAVREIREGDEEDAAEALGKVLKAVSHSRPELDKGQITTLVEEKLREKADEDQEKQNAAVQAQHDVAEAKFKEEFGDLMENNPYFFEIAKVEDVKLQNEPEWQSKPLIDRYMEAGKLARGFLEGKKIVSESKEEKLKKKASAKQVKSGTARAKLGEDEHELTRSDVIKEIRASRHQSL